MRSSHPYARMGSSIMVPFESHQVGLTLIR
jgi:hypothetical protein